MNILGVEISDMPEREVLAQIKLKIDKGEQIFITTPNPEIVLLAQKDEKFKEILNQADFCIPDGFGLKIGARILGGKLNSRITGTDFMKSLCEFAKNEGRSVYFLGAGEGIAKRASENLKKQIPNLKVVGTSHQISQGLALTKESKGEFLFVALGQGKQEKWIFENLPNMPQVKLAMGVGGAFDFYSGKIKRAPIFLRRVGLEWLWRLLQEPKRIKRILNAVIVFPINCFFYKSINQKNIPKKPAKDQN